MPISKKFSTTAGIILLLINALTASGQRINYNNYTGRKPDNIILFIGDGMGVAQLYAGLTVNHGKLNLLHFKSLGYSKTYSAFDYVTDSGAGATAIATGNKTYNGAIGVSADSVPVRTILEYAEMAKLSTGLVSTSAITHATPASFIAHNLSRENYEEIASDFLKTDIDVFIGGGLDNFINRQDKRNLVNELKSKNYQVVYSMDSAKQVTHGKLAALTARMHNPSIMKGRGDMLPVATKTAIEILDNNKKGFFLMVEGSQIDWGSHNHDTDFVTSEMIDFDNAIGIAYEYAKENKNTLIIVTADHETGGMVLTDGNYQEGRVSAEFMTKDHTGIMVPLFAFGPGAEIFQGIQENTEIFHKMMKLLDFLPATSTVKP